MVFGVTCHDSGDGWGDSPVEKLEGVISNLGRAGPVLALSSWCNHAWLEEDTLKERVVFSKVEENLSPNLLCHLKSPVNSMFSIKQDFWLHNWDQPVVLNNIEKTEILIT